jgi:hypothetical protein
LEVVFNTMDPIFLGILCKKYRSHVDIVLYCRVFCGKLGILHLKVRTRLSFPVVNLWIIAIHRLKAKSDPRRSCLPYAHKAILFLVALFQTPTRVFGALPMCLLAGDTPRWVQPGPCAMAQKLCAETWRLAAWVRSWRERETYRTWIMWINMCLGKLPSNNGAYAKMALRIWTETWSSTIEFGTTEFSDKAIYGPFL